jgi:anaerobic magnesium-protoporphyrin IX monomethyl ester cyclase
MAHSEPSSIASHKVLLINPPSPPGQAANREGAGGFGAWSAGDDGFVYPPQTLAYTAAVLRTRGWTVRVIDATGERLDADAAMQRVSQGGDEIIAVLVAHISLENDIDFINQLHAALPQAHLLAMGASMPFAGPILLERTDVEHVIVGEPEAMLLPVCQTLKGESSIRRLRRAVTPADIAMPGIDREGRLIVLDSLPFPAWDLFPVANYPFLTVSTSRGCTDACLFCPYVVGQGRYLRVRAPERVVDEMEWLAATFHPKRVIVRDPVFALDRERVVQICRGLIDGKIKLAWECESRPDHFDVDLLRLMHVAGCTMIKLGLETANEGVLRAVRRIAADGSAEEYIRQTARVAAACRTLDMACRIFVMTGLPGQNDGTIASTLSCLQDIQPTAVNVKPFHRYPGLPMPAANLDEERRRGDAQALLLQEKLSHLLRPAAPSMYQRLRGWLRRRIRR